MKPSSRNEEEEGTGREEGKIETETHEETLTAAQDHEAAPEQSSSFGDTPRCDFKFRQKLIVIFQ